MKEVLHIFKERYGYAYMKDLKAKGIHTDTIRKLQSEGKIEKVKAGLYKLTDMPVLTNQGMIDITFNWFKIWIKQYWNQSAEEQGGKNPSMLP